MTSPRAFAAVAALTAAMLGAAALLGGCSSGSSSASGGAGAPAGAAPESAPAPEAEGAAPASPQVLAAVKGFYEHHATDPSRAGSGQYLTDTAAAAVFAPGTGADRAYCAPTKPTSVTFAPPVVADDHATVVVTTHRQGSADQKVTVTVALPDILISKITCPGP